MVRKLSPLISGLAALAAIFSLGTVQVKAEDKTTTSTVCDAASKDKRDCWYKASDNTWTYSFSVTTDDTVPYYYWEDDLSGYTSDHPVASPGITENGAGVVTNTSNSLDVGSLQIVKITTTKSKFTFDVSLTAADGSALSGNAIYGGTVFVNGKATVKVGRDDPLTITGIPSGYKYTVTEQVPSGYTMTSTGDTGTIAKGETAVATFTNEPPVLPEKKPGTVTIHKSVEGFGKDPAAAYNFSISFSGLLGETAYPATIAGTDETITSDNNGTLVYAFALADGQTASFTGLPSGSTYVITETGTSSSQNQTPFVASYTASSNGEVTSSSKENSAVNSSLSTDTETVEPDETAEFNFKNVLRDYEDLTLTKVLDSSTPASGDPSFEFTVNFTGMTPGASFNSDIGRIVADDDGACEKTFYVKAGQRVVFNQVPAGTQYQFTESENAYIASYAVTAANGARTIVSASAANTEAKKALATAVETVDNGEAATVTFTNKANTSSASLAKNVTGSFGNRFKNFAFTISLKNGSTPISGSFQYTGDKTGALEFNSAGKAKIDLRAGQKITIANLPVGSTLTMEEDDYSKEGYTVSYANSSGRNSAAGTDEASLSDNSIYVNEDAAKNVITATNARDGSVPTGIRTGGGAAAAVVTGAVLLILVRKIRNYDKKGV